MATPATHTHGCRKRGCLNVHWKSSGLMLGPFLFGILLAIAHDQVYAYYDGKPVSSPTQQQWVGRIGTGLAFLIKKLFSTAVGVACVQMLWWTLRNRPIAIKTIDSSFSIVSNPFALKNFRLFKEVPAIVFLAVIAWLMPIAALIAPPSITIIPNSYQSSSVQQLNIPAINWTIKYDENGNNNGNQYSGVQPGIQRVAMQVALATHELAFSPPGSFKNSSYLDSFFGPALQCEQANQTWYDAAFDAAKAETANFESGVWYLAWTPYNNCAIVSPSDPYGRKNLTTYLTLSPSDDCNNPNDPSLETIDAQSTDAAQIFMATWNEDSNTYPLAVYQCSLYNASYTVNFSFMDGISSYAVQKQIILNPVSFSDADNSTVDVNYVSTPSRAYIALMDALGKILIGYVSTFEFATSLDEVGTIIFKTPLIETSDFSADLTQLGLGDLLPNSTTKTMGTAVEELMTNLTMSLFSQPHYLVSESSYPLTNVTIILLENQYNYVRWQLLTAYGTGAAFALFSIFIGFWCLNASEAAYSNKFSTMMRVMRDSDFQNLIQDHDTSGINPLPSYLKNVKVGLRELSSGDVTNTRYAITILEEPTRESINRRERK